MWASLSPGYYTFEIQNRPEVPAIESKTIKAPKHYLWSEESKLSFLSLLKSDEFNAKLDKSDEVDHSDPSLVVNHVSEVLVSAAEKAKVKFCKNDSKNDAPWFDKPCRDLKESIKNLGKSVRIKPKDDDLRNELFSKKRN